MGKNILILGGYGGVGRHLARLLVHNGDHKIIIAGRNLEKAKSFSNKLSTEYKNASISHRQIDARSPGSLNNGMNDIDLVVVTATVPDCMDDLARVALHYGVDMMDVLVRSDVVDQLSQYKTQAVEDGRLFITQGGFHPGMILPMMKKAISGMEEVEEVEVFMAMNPVFETVESTKEIFYESLTEKPMVLKDGKWIKASYTESKSCEFSNFGMKNCYPLKMLEIESIDEELGVRNGGTYVGGFNWFIDNVVFTIVFLLGMINVNLGQNIGSRLMFQAAKKYQSEMPEVEMIIKASGQRRGEEYFNELRLNSDDGYLLTAQAIYSLINQYLSGKFIVPGIHLMGKLIDEHQMVTDLIKMGVEIKNTWEKTTPKSQPLQQSN